MQLAKGQILIEVMVALSIVVVAFSGAMGLLGTSVGLTRNISNQYVGTYLAAEGVEIVKSIVDLNYATGAAFNAGMNSGTCFEADFNATDSLQPASCALDSLRSLWSDGSYYGYAHSQGDVETTFRRLIQVQQVGGGDELDVTVTVRWSGKGGTFETVVGDHFTQWWE